MNSNLFSNLSDWAIELLKTESIWNAVWELVLDCPNDAEIENLLLDYGYQELCLDIGL